MRSVPDPAVLISQCSSDNVHVLSVTSRIYIVNNSWHHW